MSWFVRFLCNFVGGMAAATGVILIYVYLLGAPHLPRLPVIGLPTTYVALALLVAWLFVQLWLSLLGLIADGLLSLVGLREPPGAGMAFWHGIVATTVLLLLGAWAWPVVPSLSVIVLWPLAVHGGVRLVAGRLPRSPS